jgi:hypothetical protein
MKPIQHLSLSFGIVLCLGSILFFYQTRQYSEIRNRRNSLPASANAVKSLKNETLPPSLQESSLEKKAKPSASDLADAFTEKFKNKMLSSITPETLNEFFDEGALEKRIYMIAGLTTEETTDILVGLKPYELEQMRIYLNQGLTPAKRGEMLAEVKRRREAWLAVRIGKERYAAVLLSDEVVKNTSAEEGATNAINRLVSAVNLTDAQKEKLHAGFIEQQLNPAAAPEERLVVTTNGSIQREPPGPDLSEELKKNLTPEQWNLYQKPRADDGHINSRNQVMINVMMESLQPALVELMLEGQ